MLLLAQSVKAQSGAPSVSLLPNGSFSGVSHGVLEDWANISQKLPVTIGNDGGNPIITLTTSDTTTTTGVVQSVPVQPDWSKVLVRGYIRVLENSAATPTGTPFIGVNLVWQDKSGHPVSQIAPQTWLDSTPGWVEVNQLLDVPPGASSLVIAPKLANSEATVSFKALSLTAWISTFRDHFDNGTLDANKWGITTGRHNVASNELEWFSPNDVIVANKMLDIHGEQKAANGFDYESGQISTIGKFQQLYGLFEFDLKLPVTQGAWPAAYLLRYDDCWPPEIDVEELSGADTYEVLETNHYADDFGRSDSSNVNFSSSDIDRTQWHKYAVVWEPGNVAWYVDGIYRGTTGEPYSHVSDDPMYITINLAIGSFGGDPGQSTWPQDFYCRAVDAYQRTDLGFPLYPEQSVEITLPVKTVTLSALGADTENDGKITWKLAEGPSPVTIKNPHLLTTSATVTKPGMYRFTVTQTKGQVSNSADLLVYVNKALGS